MSSETKALLPSQALSYNPGCFLNKGFCPARPLCPSDAPMMRPFTPSAFSWPAQIYDACQMEGGSWWSMSRGETEALVASGEPLPADLQASRALRWPRKPPFASPSALCPQRPTG